MPPLIIPSFLAALALSSATGRAQEIRGAGPWSATEAELVPGDPMQGAYFGYDVAISGDTAVVGAFGNDAAYVFVRVGEGWTEQQKLVSFAPISTFGGTVAISGDTIVVGKEHVGLYVFQREGSHWSQVGSSRVDLQACKLEYSIVSPK